jgi:hypothetical protein
VTECKKHEYGLRYGGINGQDCPDCREDAGLVGCDLGGCTAKKAPVTLKDFVVALEHARRHHYLGGCSHGY